MLRFLQLQHLSLLASVQNDLEATKNERDRLTHELAKYKRMSSGSIDIAGSLIETVPSALGQVSSNLSGLTHITECFQMFT